MSLRFTEEEAKDLGFRKDSKGNWLPPKADIQRKDSREMPKPESNVLHKIKGKNETKERGATESRISNRFRIVVTSFRRRHMDPDNLCPKHAIDVLVKRGIIPDDSSVYISAIEKKVIKIKNHEEEYTEIEVFEEIP